MKEIQGRASAAVAVPVEECFALLVAIEEYPRWFEPVRAVEILEREPDGRALLARAELHVRQSPFGTDFELVLAVRSAQPESIALIKLPDDPSDEDRLELQWSLQRDSSTRIRFEFDAALSFVPGFLPVGSAGDLVAAAILGAATSAVASR
jgi:ribosome-associated toxin RatA of RatAB toxin-antitoxin module